MLAEKYYYILLKSPGGTCLLRNGALNFFIKKGIIEQIGDTEKAGLAECIMKGDTKDEMQKM
jgi:hypothetical protein